jgi:hypothetical protein
MNPRLMAATEGERKTDEAMIGAAFANVKA